MKHTMTFMLLIVSAFSVNAQMQNITADKSKAIATNNASVIFTTPCSGLVTPKSADLKWKPILVRKVVEIEHESPNEELIDSLNAVHIAVKSSLSNSYSSEKTTVVTPIVGANFAGNTNSGSSPLDNSIAISYGGAIMSVANATVYCYDTFGTSTYVNDMASFIGDATITSVCDPVVTYDPVADRFIFFCQQVVPTGSPNKIIVMFSQTNNPALPWWRYEWDGDPTGAGDFFDYPKIAINDSELFITGNMFSGSPLVYHQSIVIQMDKLSGYAGASINSVYYSGIAGSPFTLLPVSYGQYGDLTTGMNLISTNNGGGSSINFYQISGNWCCSPTMTYWSVPTTTYTTPSDASQLGTSTALQVRDCRALSGFYLNGIVHFTFQSGNPTTFFDEINYNRLNLSTLTNQSSTFGISNSDLGYPAVASFATTTTDKSVMIGFGRSNSLIYPEIRVVNCDDGMNWSTSKLVKSSNSYASMTSTTVERWGDYTGMCRNHSSPTASVWMSGMFANPTNEWDTWIAEINGGMSTTNINQPTENKSVKVYPNPTNNTFNIDFSLDADCPISIIIIDASGKIVKELYNGTAHIGMNDFSFDKANLKSGVYSLLIQSDSKTIKNEKLTVIN